METETAGYATWLRSVDAELERVVGLSHRDLADRNYRDEFEAGVSPREAALEAIADESGIGAALADEIAGAVDEASGAVTSDAGPGL